MSKNFETLVVFNTETRKVLGDYSTLADAARCVMKQVETVCVRTKRFGDEIGESVRREHRSSAGNVSFYTSLSLKRNIGVLVSAYDINPGDVEGMRIDVAGSLSSLLRSLTDEQLNNIHHHPHSDDVLLENGTCGQFDYDRDFWARSLVMRERNR